MQNLFNISIEMQISIMVICGRIEESSQSFFKFGRALLNIAIIVSILPFV